MIHCLKNDINYFNIIKWNNILFSASRAKLRTVNTISKMRGQAKTAAYPQPEGTLGEHMCKHGKDPIL